VYKLFFIYTLQEKMQAFLTTQNAHFCVHKQNGELTYRQMKQSVYPCCVCTCMG